MNIKSKKLTVIPVCWMPIYRIPRHVRKRTEQLCTKFLWFEGSSVRKKGYCLVPWKSICTSLEQEGLGIINLKTMNIALWNKWLYRLYSPLEKGLRKTIIQARYTHRRSLTNCSPFWKEISKELPIFIKKKNWQW
jgi:hypothetical protein